jgi:hypothetical protein
MAVRDHMDQGLSLEEAIQKMMVSNFDYHDMGRTEKNFASIMMPFYRWFRNNAPWQIYNMATRPVIYATIPQAAREFQNAMVGNDAMPESLRPEWFRNQMGIQIMGDKKGGTGVMVNTMLPSKEAFDLGSMAMGGKEGFSTLAGTLNPFIGEVFSQASGHDVFTGRALGSEEKGVIGYARRIERGLRPLREFGMMQKAVEQGDAGNIVSRGLLGGRAQQLTEERGLRYADTETRNAIDVGKAAMKKAVRDKSDPSAAAKTVEDANRKRLELGLKVGHVQSAFLGQPVAPKPKKEKGTGKLPKLGILDLPKLGGY